MEETEVIYYRSEHRLESFYQDRPKKFFEEADRIHNFIKENPGVQGVKIRQKFGNDALCPLVYLYRAIKIATSNIMDSEFAYYKVIPPSEAHDLFDLIDLVEKVEIKENDFHRIKISKGGIDKLEAAFVDYCEEVNKAKTLILENRIYSRYSEETKKEALEIFEGLEETTKSMYEMAKNGEYENEEDDIFVLENYFTSLMLEINKSVGKLHKGEKFNFEKLLSEWEFFKALKAKMDKLLQMDKTCFDIEDIKTIKFFRENKEYFDSFEKFIEKEIVKIK